MNLIRSSKKLASISLVWKNAKEVIGLVPTMGFLHEGHLQLIRDISPYVTKLIVSIFVNPIQFAQGEDFKVYPRDLERDLQLCETLGVDLVFAPSPEEMYSEHFSTYVEEVSVSQGLCAVLRPGHFRGVTTIVLCLFNLSRADYTIFGEKDFQQLKIIKKMVKDLFIPIKLLSTPIVREKNGLAMSSRNQYLSKKEFDQASIIYKTLKKYSKLVYRYQDYESLLEEIAKEIHEIDGDMNYLQAIDIKSLAKLTGKIKKHRTFRVVISVYFGKSRVRLLDNINMTYVPQNV